MVIWIVIVCALVLMLAESNRELKLEKMRQKLDVGDKIITTDKITGIIKEIHGESVLLENDQNNEEIKIKKSSIDKLI